MIALPTCMPSALAELARLGAHVVITGSSIASYVTPTSDIDYVVVGPEGPAEIIAKRLDAIQTVDVRFRSTDWLRSFVTAVVDHPDSYNGAIPPFPYWDLHFLNRLMRGNVIVGDDEAARLVRIAAGARRTFLAHWVGVYLNIYQDLYGLLTAGRYREIIPKVGEFLEVAGQCALYLTRNVEFARKWAFATIDTLDDPDLTTAVADCLELLCRAEPSADWSRAALRMGNRMIAAGYLSANRIEAAVDAEPSTGDGLEPAHCLLANDTAFLACDVDERRIVISNAATFAAYLHTRNGSDGPRV